MPDFWTVSRAFLTMMMMMVLGAVLAYAVGMAHDVLYTYLVGMGIDGGAGTKWDSTQSMWVITALMYFVCSLPPVLGIAIFALSVTRRQRRDEFYEAGEIYNQEE
jgi:hypothetical protein